MASESLDYQELQSRKVETLEEALDLIEDLRENLIDSVARSIGRNSDYESEIKQIKDTATVALQTLENSVQKVESHRARIGFLSQVLIAIVFYGGDDAMIPRDLAAVAIREQLPPELQERLS